MRSSAKIKIFATVLLDVQGELIAARAEIAELKQREASSLQSMKSSNAFYRDAAKFFGIDFADYESVLEGRADAAESDRHECGYY